MIGVLHQACLLAWMRLLPARRNPMGLVLVFIYPCFFIAIYTAIGGENMTTSALLGLPVVYMLNTGVVALPQATVEYSLRHLKDVFVASPVSPFAYAFGMGLSRILFVAPVLALWFVIAIATDTIDAVDAPLVMAVLLAAWVVGCAIGFLLATYVTDIGTMSAAANLIGLVLTILLPVLYPIDVLPPPYNLASLLAPSVSVAQLIRIITANTEHATAIDTLTCVTVLLAWSVAFSYVAIRRSRWRET